MWLYRIQPSVVVGRAASVTKFHNVNDDIPRYFGGVDPLRHCETEVNPLRWKPPPNNNTSNNNNDFCSGMRLVCAAGDPSVKSGLAIYMYQCGKGMQDQYLYNADGEFLIVPQHRSLQVDTELGRFVVHPTEIMVVPRGVVFQVNLLMVDVDHDTPAVGYVLEVYQGSFQLPELGPIGSNGLANARDFYYPTAWVCRSQENYQTPCTILCKVHSRLFCKSSNHSPFNVVAWHGNYLPYKYDLKKVLCRQLRHVRSLGSQHIHSPHVSFGPQGHGLGGLCYFSAPHHGNRPQHIATTVVSSEYHE